MNKIIQNAKHLASTVPGLAIGLASSILALANLPFVVALAGSNAQVAKYVTAAVGIATSLTLIFGVGPKS